MLLFPGTECSPSARGYFTDEGFEAYIDFLVDESKEGIPNDGRWRILVVDGYGSHTMVPTVLQKLLDRKIICVSMPSHTSHELQPLDVTCFRPTSISGLCGTYTGQAVSMMLVNMRCPIILRLPCELGARNKQLKLVCSNREVS